MAEIRTFSLITLFGALFSMVARHFDQGWLIAAGLIALAMLLAVANVLKKQEDEADVGQTTETAALLRWRAVSAISFRLDIEHFGVLPILQE